MREKEHKKNEVRKDRRNFLIKAWKILGLVVAVEIILFISSFFRSSKSSGKFENKELLKALGFVDDFLPGSVTIFRMNKLFLIRRKEDKGFLAISLTCSHLGCSVHWDEESRKFQCPCHSSCFDDVGNVLSSPATQALDYFPVFIEGGKVLVNTSQKLKRKRFQKSQLTYAS
jgi:Rieske Fe-S protein